MSITKKFVLFATVCLGLAIFVLPLSGCSKQSKTSGNSLADKTLTIGVCANHEPMSYTDSKQNVKGFEIDLGNAIAKKLGVNPFWINTSWNSIFDRMNKNKYDCVISSVTRTSSRKDNFCLSDSYFTNNIVIVAKNGQEEASDQNKTLENIQDKKIGIVVNSGGAGTAKAHLNHSDVQKYNTIDHAFEALKNNSVDYLLIDESEAVYFSKKYPNKYQIVSKPVASEQYVIVCRKNNKRLTNQINHALRQIKQDGTYENLTMKWFGQNMSPAQ
ncbi:substrate-binding periplasmic protein [Pseudoramibacter sp.]|uniref:substrate-binding periplasmic protein n=1 Tax=Pseudoramibacter sp. TaxID=2034862 RepID=UPI0025F2A90A|nr:ABC transporter substrate-binding protein [Pseudoramibacter sp.]MCH4072810.1 ABC transporter substrate-binding protein [Pseudoramibacter sp.]MCH4106581.1 ABC transporter substrate-binding protein [Pseudoramibacter sp.]